VCLGSTTLHKFECDLVDSEQRASAKIRDILKDYYKDKEPFGWKDYVKKLK
jgi:hypothetical protein